MNAKGHWHYKRRTQQQKEEVGLLLAELKECSVTRNLERGKNIHALVVKTESNSCIYVATALIKMYAKCGKMADAHQVFDSIKHPDVVSWTSLILGYAENGDGMTSLDLFVRMKSHGCAPDRFTFVAVLKACATLALEQNASRRAELLVFGKQIHLHIGYHSDVFVQSALVDMYAKCNSMLDARQVFDRMKNRDVVSWTALILGYAENGEGSTALELFSRMKFETCEPNSVTFIAALKACSSLAMEQDGRAECLERGKEIHLDIGCRLTIYVQNTLIDMYCKCRSMNEAIQVFRGIKHPDVVSWNALILGYAENGNNVSALEVFARMKSQGCDPNWITFMAVLKASGSLGALEYGRGVHAEIGTECSTNLRTCLVDFYAKCSDLSQAEEVFALHSAADLKTWTALLAGYATLGDVKAVSRLFKGMQDAGYRPDGVTFLCMLSCCSNAGLVERAEELFEKMPRVYGIARALEHYNCLVEMLGRSNKLDDAVSFIRGMPCRPDGVTWVALLAACRRWKNVGIGSLAFKSLVSLDHRNAAAYLLMAHIYASIRMWKEQEIVLAIYREGSPRTL